MKRCFLLLPVLLSITLSGQRQVSFNSAFTYAYKGGCNYALVYETDSNKRLEFYNCANVLVKSQSFLKSFNPKKDFVRDFLQGEELTFYRNGRISGKSYYRDGLKQGVATLYFENGDVSQKTNYIRGQKHGQEQLFYRNGNKSVSYVYKDGMREGEELSYAADGRLLCQGTWKNNNRIEGSFFQQLKNTYLKFETYENSRLLRSTLLNLSGDTSSVYLYHLVNSELLLKRCIAYTEGKISNIYDFNPSYRDSMMQNTFQKTENKKTDSTVTAPVFKGGDEAMQEFLGEVLIYPQNCLNDEIKGEIMVYFILGREGNIVDLFTNGKGHKDLEKAAKDAILQSDGMWISGTKHGDPTVNKCRLPITFALEDE